MESPVSRVISPDILDTILEKMRWDTNAAPSSIKTVGLVVKVMAIFPLLLEKEIFSSTAWIRTQANAPFKADSSLLTAPANPVRMDFNCFCGI